MKKTLIATALALASTFSFAAWSPMGYEPAIVICEKLRTKEYVADKSWCNNVQADWGVCRLTIIWVENNTVHSCNYNAYD